MQAELFFQPCKQKALKKEKKKKKHSKTTKAALFALKLPRRRRGKKNAMGKIHNSGCLKFRVEKTEIT